jgi:hypothetical protein
VLCVIYTGLISARCTSARHVAISRRVRPA